MSRPLSHDHSLGNNLNILDFFDNERSRCSVPKNPLLLINHNLVMQVAWLLPDGVGSRL